MSGGRAYSTTLAKDLIRVEVDTVLYALEVARIREIVNPLPLIELPRERPFVLGVSDYREQVVAVVDLRRLFGLPPQEVSRRTKWIIIEAAGMLVGVVVDAVLDVFSSAEHPRREVPVLDERHRGRGITSAYHHDEQLVFLLDPERLVEPAMDIHSGEVPSLPSEAP
ncbi:MAG: purine-binding chemotaxis protein CheW [Deltaproteobacteria bacterium]|nr:purine-binding chemotaxis protein CheW [Deltaproteobacteria bacterium]MBW2209638.1 purine-binding chemotaxis protein CheW [Deltaproteobacteria bacterium]MBW2213987.1 purine-binding chemotaxis protein CheW [Deltaproteobacteria bacterium]MBW2380579.1 purine-binding chemotaxis protein CheW [Deltaproteobacteria bacterium]MBW2550545.1 purine-binding chemotaxis protein CheW [Deltaproteobacteria bacterium]